MIRALLVILGLMVIIGTGVGWYLLVWFACGMSSVGCRGTPSFIPHWENAIVLAILLLIGGGLIALGLRPKKRPQTPAA